MSEVLLLASAVEALMKTTTEDGKQISRKMSFRTKSRLVKAYDKISRELVPYESTRVDLIKRLGVPIKEGEEPLQVPEKSLKKFYEELGKALETKTEINLDYCKLTDEDIEGIEGNDIELQDEAIRTFVKYMQVETA